MGSLRIGVVANPVAGRKRGAQEMRRVVESLRGHGHQVEAVMTGEPGEAVGRSRALADEGVDIIVSIGGDGTLNEVVNGVYSSRNAASVAIGMVPAGRGRDTARTLGSLSRTGLTDPVTWQSRMVDLGLVQSAGGKTRVFVNGAGIGFDAAVASHAIRFRGMPGTAPYFLATAIVLPTFKPFCVQVRSGARTFAFDALAVMASNGKYVGGGMKVAPAANPADGLLDFLVMKALPKPEFAANFLRVYRGTHVTHPAIVTFRATEAVLSSDRVLLTHVDGEIETEVTTAISILPGALRWIGLGQ